MESELQPTSLFRNLLKKRNDFDVLQNILSAAEKGKNETVLMNKCHINQGQFQIYLQFLVELGLLARHYEKDGSKLKHYEITLNGLNFLGDYHSLKGLIS